MIFGSSEKKLARKLHLQGTYLRQLFEHSNEGIAIVDLKDNVIDVNQAFCEIFKFSLDEIMGKNLNELLVPQNQLLINLSVDSRPISFPKITRLRKDDTTVQVSVMGIPILSGQKLIGSYWLYQDITGKVKAEESRRKTEIRFRLLAENISDLICLHKPDGSYDYISPSAHKMLGYEVEELMGVNILTLIHPDEKSIVEESYNKAIRSNVSSEATYRIKQKSGIYVWLETNIQPIAKKGQVTCIVTSSRDITKSVLADEQIKNSLNEKQILLSEIHHRVKNNLAIAASLIKLQVDETENEQIRSMFIDTYNRIHSMSVVHEQLYQSNNFEKVELKNFLIKLTSFIFHSIGKQGITYTVDSDDLFLKLKAAIPFGLIVNELFTNSLKHAFKDRDQGIITIQLRKINETTAMLTFQDDGMGLPDDFDVKLTETKGMTLMKGLVNQLKGHLNLNRDNGTTFNLTFDV